MPAIEYYTVTEEREVKVAASSPEIAVQIASEAFEQNSTTGLPPFENGRVQSPIKTISISAREDY